MKCPSCGWEGKESELIEEPSKLDPTDQFYILKWYMGTTRRIYLCPRCRTPLQTARFLYGIQHERKDLSDYPFPPSDGLDT